MARLDHETYLSPFTWRYGSEEMRRIWSEAHRRRLLRRVWVALARAQAEMGLVTPEQVADLEAHQDDVDIARAEEIEAEIHHDLMAELRVFAEQCPVGGPILHLGATSQDILDNADALRLREALALIRRRLTDLLSAFADRIEETADLPCMGFTHLQPAEPTTVGYRLAQYAQDLLDDLEAVDRLLAHLRGKGFKGAVGTAASYAQLLDPAEMERRAMAFLGLEAYPVTTQVCPRRQDWEVVVTLAGIAQSLHRFAMDLRLLQSPLAGEWSEPFGRAQVGSSAMPFKRNPVQAENICSLARYVATLPTVAWENAAGSLLERTLDDSANRRVFLAEGFLATDEMLRRALRLVRGLGLNPTAMARNLSIYGTFAATERLLMELVRAGADRQEMHEVLRTHSMAAWEAMGAQAVSLREPNPLPDLLSADPRLTAYLPPERIRSLLDVSGYVGDAPRRARALAQRIRERLSPSTGQ